ncbi:xanthine dehydrogenase family protein subunit M [Amycolatopsis sp. NPDC023774]|uniref:FAD binding domain-containing protein n=1 Tax=Amycolatopsis sp. NPDC023774 TaxID=3155015 RepID=UPI0033EA65BD
MRPLSYARALDVETAVATVAANENSAFLAGGTTEIDLVRLGVTGPDLLVDINALPLADIEQQPDGGLRIGALARMTDVARHSVVEERYPAASQALLLGASEQLRNMASIGGNLCQRTRCTYFRDNMSPCNKREPGSGCAALEGIHRGHAIMGTSEHCIATHPSDVAVALVAFDAVVHTTGPDGARTIPIDDFYLEPGTSPHVEHPLAHGELIVAVDLPALPIARNSVYLKFRDRQSYEFALVSIAAAVEVEDGVVRDVRLGIGGIATRPWRARRAEEVLIGAPATREKFIEAAAAELSGASLRRDNAFKAELAKRAVVRGLTTLLTGEAR